MSNPFDSLFKEIHGRRMDGASKSYVQARLLSVSSRPLLDPSTGERYFLLGKSVLGEDKILGSSGDTND